MKKKTLSIVAILSLVVLLGACGTTSDEPCARCGESPTKVFHFSSGNVAYVCEECSGKCDYCSGKATTSYESALGAVFVCEECYKKVQEVNK